MKKRKWPNGSRWIRTTTRLAIYIRDSFTCQYCSKNLREEEPRDITLDHVTPRLLGGSNDPSNLVTCCARCNRVKNERTLGQMLGAKNHYISYDEYQGAVARTNAALCRPLNRELARALRRKQSTVTCTAAVATHNGGSLNGEL